jgi:hypothetical protein
MSIFGGEKRSACSVSARRKTGCSRAAVISACRPSTSRRPATRRKSKKMAASSSASGLGWRIQVRKRSRHSASVPSQFRAM